MCVVGRREGELNAVVEECAALLPNLTGEPPKSGYVFAWRGDFGVPEDMVALRDELERREFVHRSVWVRNSAISESYSVQGGAVLTPLWSPPGCPPFGLYSRLPGWRDSKAHLFLPTPLLKVSHIPSRSQRLLCVEIFLDPLYLL